MIETEQQKLFKIEMTEKDETHMLQLQSDLHEQFVYVR